MRVEDFRDHIAALVPAFDVVIGYEPDSPDEICVVAPYGSDGTDNLLARPGLQVMIRGSKRGDGWPVAYAAAKAIHDDLANRTGTIGQNHYQCVYANQSPVQLGVDESKRPRFVVNFTIIEDRP